MKLATETTGTGRDLLLLHGWGMNAGVWGPLADQLRSHYRLTLVELPGHGNSACQVNRGRLDDWTRAVLDVAPASAVWLGWSLGGLIALNAALMAIGRVQKLILFGSTPKFVAGDDWSFGMQRETFGQFAASLQQDTAGTLSRFLAMEVRGAERATQTLAQLKQAMATRAMPQQLALQQGLKLLLETDLRDRLALLSCPSLWLFGERDKLVDQQTAEAIPAFLPTAQIHAVTGAAHAPFLSHPNVCMDYMNGYLIDD